MTIRITGISSGLDIERLVSDLMRAEKVPVDGLRQKSQSLTWQSDLYREINTKMASFRSSLNSMRLTGSWVYNKVSVSDSSAITATASPSANPVSRTIQVDRLATNARVASLAPVSNDSMTGNTLDETIEIQDTNNKFNITLNGITRMITLDEGTYDQEGLAEHVQSKLDEVFTGKIEVELVEGALSFSPVGLGAHHVPELKISGVSGIPEGVTVLGFNNQQSNKVNVNAPLSQLPGLDVEEEGNFFLINGVKINYNSSDNLNTVMNRVNNSSAGVFMTYDSLTDRVSFVSKTTGSASQINLQETGDNGNILSTLGIAPQLVSGEDALVRIDNATNPIAYGSNQFTMDGVSYTLHSVTNKGIDIGITRDIDAMYDKIANFVKEYNELIGSINERLNEPKHRSYTPLTSDQKADMKDSEIELWEKNAKSGLLRNDILLKEAQVAFRGLLIQSVEGISTSYNSLYQIGITTMPYNNAAKNDSGKIQIDEVKLREALANDPDGVISMFARQSADDDETMVGIAQRMYDTADMMVSKLTERAGAAGLGYMDTNTSVGYQIYMNERRITTAQARLEKREESYYRQFTAMEQALQRSNAQMSWLAAQLGS